MTFQERWSSMTLITGREIATIPITNTHKEEGSYVTLFLVKERIARLQCLKMNALGSGMVWIAGKLATTTAPTRAACMNYTQLAQPCFWENPLS